VLLLVFREEPLPIQPVAQSQQAACRPSCSVPPKKIEERLRAEVQKVFAAGGGVDRVYFPDKSGQIPDRPVLTLVVVAPEQSILDKATRDFIESATKESGTSGRTYKSGLVWAVPDSPDALRDEARKVLAWEDIADERTTFVWTKPRRGSLRRA